MFVYCWHNFRLDFVHTTKERGKYINVIKNKVNPFGCHPRGQLFANIIVVLPLDKKHLPWIFNILFDPHCGNGAS